LYLSGQFDLAEKRIAETEQTLKSLPDTPEREQMLALAALYRGSIAAVHGDFQQAVEQITFAQSRIPRENHLAHARAFFSLGVAYEIAEQTDLAAQNYLQSSEEAESVGVLFLAINALGAAAQVQIKQGHLHLAEQSCRQAIQLAEGARIAPLGLAWSLLGGIALEQNDLPSAERYLQDGIALSRQGGLVDDNVLGLAFLARLRAYQGDAASALAAIQEITSLIRKFGVPRMELLAAAIHARIQIYMGQTQSAAQWAAEVQPVRATISHEFVDLTLARVLLAMSERHGHCATCHALLYPAAISVHIARGALSSAEDFCQQLEEAAREYQSRAWVAMARQSRGELATAQNDFETALTCYEEASQAFKATGNEYESARCLTAMAETRRKRKSPGDAKIAKSEVVEAGLILERLNAS